MSDSTTLARAVVSSLASSGVSDVVLAPGSRSAPLAFAVAAADAAGDLRLHVRIDERTAGFLALGLAKGSHRAVAVVTTSGSAVAHLHPAVLEALHTGEPVVVISADRPAALRNTGANQTTTQPGMFGTAVPCFDVPPGDIAAAVAAIAVAVRRSGPTHLNLQFIEPLVPADNEALVLPSLAGADLADLSRDGDGDGDARGEVLAPGPRTVVVAGDGAGPRARLLAQSGNWPLLAEPTSGARTGRCALRTYRLLLETGLGNSIERVVVTGHPTLSRPVTRLICRADLEVVSVRGPGGICTDPARVARHVDVMPRAESAAADSWIDSWRTADDQLSRNLDSLVDDGDAMTLPLGMAREVAAAVPPGGLLVVGSSSPVRDLDLMARPYPVGERRLVLGNRGLSGIDGTVSTAVGAALGRPSSSRALGYLGDLTFLHDMSGLVIGPDEPRASLTLVVANDDGGAIFATLEQGDARFSASFERVFGTPQGVSLSSLCEAVGVTHRRVADADELRARLAEDAPGIRVLEVPISRTHRRQLAGRLREMVR